MTRPSQSPTYEAPTSVRAGVTLVWLLDGADAPASDGWTCAVQLTDAAGAVSDATVAQEGSTADYRVTVSAAKTRTLAAGAATWTAVASKDSEGVDLGAGRFVVRLASGKTPLRAEYDAARAALQQLREGTIAAYSVAGRTFTKHTLPDLRREVNALAGRVRAEQNGTPFVNHAVTF